MATNGTVVKSIPASIADTLKAITGESSPVKGIIAVFGTSDDMELDRVRVIAAFGAAGFSQRETLAAVAKANGGRTVRGFSKGTVSRYALVVSASTRDDLPRLTDAQRDRAIIALVNLVNTGAGASDLASAMDLAVKAGTPAAFVKSLTDTVTARAKAEYAALKAPAQRPGAITPGGKPNAPQDAPEGDAPERATSRSGRQADADSITAATPLRLIAELQRRISSRGFTPDGVLVAAFDALASEWESLASGVLTTADVE